MITGKTNPKTAFPSSHLMKITQSLKVCAALLCAASAAHGQNQLVNPGLETGDFTGWTVYSAETWNYAIADVNGGQHSNPNPPNPDVAHSGEYSYWVYGDYQGGNQYDGMYQDITTVTAGDVFSADGWAYSYANDYCFQNAANQAWIEVSFRDATKTKILALYRSAMTWPAGQWNDLQVTNQYDPNSYAITNTTSTLIAPAGTADVRYQIVFEQVNYGGGSSFWDDNDLDFISGPVPPTVSSIPLNNLTLCTNQFLTATATSTTGTITNVQVITKTSPIGSTITTTATNTLAGSEVTGLGTGIATINFPLTSNLLYTVTIVATDNNGTAGLTGAAFDTIAPTLVIEATDFNFSTNGSGGGYIDTPANGGLFLYTNQVGVEGIDEHKNTANTSTKVPYRAADEAVIQNAGSTTFNEQKYVVAGATELCVDYTSTGDWLNYTRTYGPGGSAPAGTYQVYLCMGTDGAGVQSSLYQIAGDPTSGQQSTNFIGYFGTANFSEQAWAGYEYVPLTDQYGNLVSTTIPAGPQTLRLTQIENPNIEYLMLLPVQPVLTPVLRSFYPDGVHPMEPTNHFAFVISPANGSNILASGIDLVVNGVDVTSNATITASGNSWAVSYPIKSNAVYTTVISVTNTAGISSVFPINFDTFSPGNYQLEAVDYDFTVNGVSAQFIDNPVPTGDYNACTMGEFATNSYFGYPEDLVGQAVAAQGIDINFGNSGQGASSECYRAQDGVGTQDAGDYVRPKFVAAQQEFNDPNIGPFNLGYFAGGYWLNYTRHYPTNNYYVWARLAGGGGPITGTTLSVVTNGVGTANQETDLLGTFSDPLAAGWQTYHWVPMLDANSNMVAVSMGGLATLRLTSGGNVNAEFLMLVPAPPSFPLSATVSGGQINLSFPTQTGYTYNIVYKSSLTAGAWTPVGSPISGTGSTATVSQPATQSQGYYSVTVQ